MSLSFFLFYRSVTERCARKEGEWADYTSRTSGRQRGDEIDIKQIEKRKEIFALD